MKHIIYLFTLILLIGCSASTEQKEMPTDLDGLKTLLKEKRASSQALNNEMKVIEKAIEKLDPNTKKKLPLVVTAPIKRETFERFVEIQGNVAADDLVIVSSETGGRITSLKVREGQNVSRGQLIATVDLESINKQIAEVQTGLDLATTTFERQSKLWDQNIGSEMQFLQAKNNKERLEKTLETLNFQLTKGNAYAPISGAVEKVLLKSGELAGPGMPIIQILNTRKIKVVAEVPESYLKSIRKGEKVSIKFPALDEETTARVTLIGNTINPNNRTFKVEANIANAKSTLKPNLLALMLIKEYEEKDAIAIEQSLVQQEIGGTDYVFIAKEGDKGSFAKKVFVKTGETSEGKVIITEGLEGDESIIIKGNRGLQDEQLIKLETLNENNG